MELKLIEHGGRPSLCLKGRFDATVSFDFFAMAAKAMLRYPDRDIEVDLAGVDYIDSSAIGKLIHFNQQLAEKRHRVLVANCTPAVRKVLTMMGIDKLMTIA